MACIAFIGQYCSISFRTLSQSVQHSVPQFSHLPNGNISLNQSNFTGMLESPKSGSLKTTQIIYFNFFSPIKFCTVLFTHPQYVPQLCETDIVMIPIYQRKTRAYRSACTGLPDAPISPAAPL